MQQASERFRPTGDKVATSIAEANADLARRAYAALNANDLEGLAMLLHADVSWYTPGRSPVAGEALGRDAVLAQFARYATGSWGTFRANLREVLHSEDGRIVAIHHDTGERNRKRLDVGCCTVFEFEDGVILEGRDHFHDLYNWDEFWSRHL
jgi:uncharacterized protein